MRLDVGPRRIHDLPGVGRQRAVGAGLEIGLSMISQAASWTETGAAPDHDVAAVPPRRGLALLALALLRPLLGDALDGVDDARRLS